MHALAMWQLNVHYVRRNMKLMKTFWAYVWEMFVVCNESLGSATFN